MKIGILIDELYPGGVQRVAAEEVIHLKERDYNVKLVAINRSKEEVFFKDSSIPMEFLSDRFPSILNQSFKFPFFSFFSSYHVTSSFITPFKFSNSDFDLIIAHGTSTCFTAYSLWKRKKIPYIAFIHDPMSYILPKVYSNRFLRYFFPILLPMGRYLDELIVKNALCTITQSSVHASWLNNISGRKIDILHNACHPLRKIPKNRGDFILAATKWDIGKNPNFLLEVLKNVKGDMKMIVAGSWSPPSLIDEFIRKIKEEGLADRVEVTGYVNEETLSELYSTARVLIHPIIEAFGMTVLEAAAHGCPFIIPKGSGVNDLFQDGVHGFFPDAGDIKSYVECINRLFKYDDMAWNMGNAAWNIAKKNTWRHHAEKLGEIIERFDDGKIGNDGLVGFNG